MTHLLFSRYFDAAPACDACGASPARPWQNRARGWFGLACSDTCADACSRAHETAAGRTPAHAETLRKAA